MEVCRRNMVAWYTTAQARAAPLSVLDNPKLQQVATYVTLSEELTRWLQVWEHPQLAESLEHTNLQQSRGNIKRQSGIVLQVLFQPAKNCVKSATPKTTNGKQYIICGLKTQPRDHSPE